MEDKLKDIFHNINSWINHAETKSASLLAGNGVLIFGVIKTINWNDSNIVVQIIISLAITQLVLSFIICLISFIPALSMPWVFKKNEPNENDNLIYFQDASKYAPLQYLRKLSKSLALNRDDFTEYEVMLTKQIITNAVIACRKYKLFKISILLALSGICTPIIFVFLNSID